MTRTDFDHIDRQRKLVEARKAGLDVRPGRRVDLRVKSRSLNQIVAGKIVPFGDSLVLDVHERDVPDFMALVDRTTETETADVDRELARRARDADTARREGARAPLVNRESCYRHVLGRDPLPFELVEVLDGNSNPATEAPAKRSRT